MVRPGQEITITTNRSSSTLKPITEDEINPFADAEEFTFGELMVISAARREQKIEESPSTISVITAEDIANSGAQTLYDLIQRVPEMNTRFLGIYTYADLRASTVDSRNSRILFLVNGVPWNSPDNASIDNLAQAFTLINVERIEIIRGPGSSLYGTNALNGGINIITRKAGSFKGIQTVINTGSFNHNEVKFMAGTKIKSQEIMLTVIKLDWN
jgi:outer membrane cobalamin receptor